ncbi:MAG: RecQ family ATP-dependent DNA helicase [Actinomycetota bacterium]
MTRLDDAVRAVLGPDAGLRPEQRSALEALAHGPTVLVARSGAGKTAVYDIASRLREGLTVVVSPTLSLQRDQRAALEATGRRAAVLNSSLTARQAAGVLDDVRAGALDVVLLAPEQLGRDPVAEALGATRVGLLVVDEAHCVSEWGHDFRPDYLQVAAAAERMAAGRVLAMTATASKHVRDDIVERLGIEGASVVVGDVDRPNIWLGARDAADAGTSERIVVDAAVSLDGAGIVYAQTRADVDRLAEALTSAGRAARGYHAGMASRDRDAVQDEFTSGRADLVVATSAFGMGIDRADVRFVVHAGPSPSLDAYYQEVGRAGRDGQPATALLVHRGEDFALGRYLRGGGGPRPATLERVAQALRAGGPLGRRELVRASGLADRTVARAVGALVGVAAVTRDDDGRLAWAADDDLPAVLERIAADRERRRATDASRVEMVRTYADTLDCRRRVLLELLGEERRDPCGNCDSCDAGTSEAVGHSRFRTGQRVEHREFGPGTVSLVESDRVTVLFEEHGYTTLALELLDGENSPLRAG